MRGSVTFELSDRDEDEWIRFVDFESALYSHERLTYETLDAMLSDGTSTPGPREATFRRTNGQSARFESVARREATTPSAEREVRR